MSHTDLNTIAPQLAALTTDEVMTPNMPVPTFVHQGELMRVAATKDAARLRAAGVDPALIEALGTQLAGLATAEA